MKLFRSIMYPATEEEAEELYKKFVNHKTFEQHEILKITFLGSGSGEKNGVCVIEVTC